MKSCTTLVKKASIWSCPLFCYLMPALYCRHAVDCREINRIVISSYLEDSWYLWLQLWIYCAFEEKFYYIYVFLIKLYCSLLTLRNIALFSVKSKLNKSRLWKSKFSSKKATASCKTFETIFLTYEEGFNKSFS